jgi:hypothetical protein
MNQGASRLINVGMVAAGGELAGLLVLTLTKAAYKVNSTYIGMFLLLLLSLQ